MAVYIEDTMNKNLGNSRKYENTSQQSQVTKGEGYTTLRWSQ